MWTRTAGASGPRDSDMYPTHTLVEHFRPYAHAIAAEILRTLPAHIEKAEVQASAELGLTQAAAAYDGRPDVQFKTFAYYRIRGAIYDGIRKATWFSREAEGCSMASIESDHIEMPAAGSLSAEELLIQHEWRTRLDHAVRALPPRDRAIIEAYYFGGKSLEEIGGGLGLSKSWVSRIHVNAIAKLRAYLCCGQAFAAA